MAAAGAGCGDEQLAIACASHGGEPEHVALVGRMLNDIGLEEGDLSCGPHEPSSQEHVRTNREGASVRLSPVFAAPR